MQSGALFDAPTHATPVQFSAVSRSAASARHSFANLPDRGDLFGYPSTPVIRHDGAYTWHRADVSEAHALRAMVSGVMEITTPAGERLKFRYERHVEHASGDLTWVGRIQGGHQSDEIILTFGEKAVFGSIAQPGKAPLRLTMLAGSSWLVETDSKKVGQIENEATRPRRPDYLIPPKSAAAWQAFSDTPAISQSSAPLIAAAAGASATTVIDVLIGYTAGFAAATNGAPLTRLNNMVETTNEAYINSGIDSRARLVHALQVDYPDNTDNRTALEELTGFKAPSTRTTPLATFNALRAARELYGADLVSLVRKFNTPENDGCGIAWLIGGGQSGVDQSDEYFGYSVVSDGRDTGADGKTYFCREETLAHELGHNMGSQHDAEAAKGADGVLDSKEYGAYPYSFGYKTGAGAGNFYTVMAYGDSGQKTFRIFSNPRSTFCDQMSCGTASADNAKSLGQISPLISTFRGTVVVDNVPSKAHNDVDGDGRSDFIWSNDATASFGYWIMNGPNLIRARGFGSSNGYRIEATGDFNGDGRLDLIWTSNLRDLLLSTGNGDGFATQSLPGYAAGWSIAGAGDVDGDGRSDLIWLNEMTATFGYWIMNGASVVRTQGFSTSKGYRIAATGDFNNDGFLDLVWTSAFRDLLLSTGTGTGFVTQRLPDYAVGWALVGAGDVDGDHRSDLIWSNETAGTFGYWIMTGATVSRSKGFDSSSGYRIAALGDFDGNGRLDLAWTSSARDLLLSSGDGQGFVTNRLPDYSAEWYLVSANR